MGKRNNLQAVSKQRVKLAQAFFTDVPVILLDEPTTNLDDDGIFALQEAYK